MSQGRRNKRGRGDICPSPDFGQVRAKKCHFSDLKWIFFMFKGYRFVNLGKSNISLGLKLCTPNSLISVEFFLFFLKKISQLHALFEPPRLLISEKPATNTVFYAMNIKKFLTTCLIRTSTLI